MIQWTQKRKQRNFLENVQNQQSDLTLVLGITILFGSFKESSHRVAWEGGSHQLVTEGPKARTFSLDGPKTFDGYRKFYGGGQFNSEFSFMEEEFNSANYKEPGIFKNGDSVEGRWNRYQRGVKSFCKWRKWL